MSEKEGFIFVFHPLLLAAYPVIFFYAHNQLELQPIIIIQPLTISLLVFVFIWVTARFIFGNWKKSGLWVSLLILSFFSYGHLANQLQNLFTKINLSFGLGLNKLLFPLAFLSLVVAALKIRKSKSSFRKANYFLNLTSLILVLVLIISLFIKEFQLTKAYQQASFNHIGSDNDFQSDIYLIILDAYARNDILEKVYGYDNSQFIETLTKMGFQVAHQANSNYPDTIYTLASTLNLNYINEIRRTRQGAADNNFYQSMIHQNKVASLLKERGYRVINIASGHGSTDDLQIADVNYRNEKTFSFLGQKIALNEFYLIFLQTTAFSPFIKDVLADQARANILYAFDKLTEIPYLRGKKFVIAHLMIPHPPFVFDENGQPMPVENLALVERLFTNRENYVKQLKFASSCIQTTLEKIISRSNPPPVIILQSDHGPASIIQLENIPCELNMNGLTERFAILYAVYAPEAEQFFYDSITPVNTFRIIFSQYFDADLPPLPNRNYLTRGNPFRFSDITDQLRENILPYYQPTIKD